MEPFLNRVWEANAMTTPDFLVVVEGTEADRDLLGFARDLKEHLNATATSILVQTDPMETLAMAGDPSYAMFSPAIVEGLKAGLSKVASANAELVAEVGEIAHESHIGHPNQILPRRSSLADFVVISCACARDQSMQSGLCETLLMEARVPVLVSRTSVSLLHGTTLVAWDGGPESGRALRRALPLLALSSRIVIAQVAKPLTERAARFVDPKRAVDFLARYGLSAEIAILSEHEKEGEALLLHAKAIKASLLVAGAYGHSRLQELIFGGATKAFLNAKDSPNLFLVH